MPSAKGFFPATRSYLPVRLLLPLILIGLLLPSAAPAQVADTGMAAGDNTGSAANAGIAVPNAIQGTNGNFGKVNVGATSVSPIAIVFTFDANVTVGSTAVVTQGAKNLDFTDAGGGTCTPNQSYSTGNTCTVKVKFKPRAPGARYGAAELLDTSGNLLANVYVQGTGVGPLVTFANSTSGDYPSSATSIIGSGFLGPNGVAVDASGNIFITDGGHNTVKEVLAVNGSIPASPTIRTLGSGFSWPYGIAVDGIGNVFIGDRGNAAVKEMMAVNGSIPASPTIRTLGGGFNFRGPNGLAVDGSGNVFVADWDYSHVYEILAAGGYTTVKNLVPGSFVAADYVAVDGSGNVYVADFDDGTVKEIMAAGGYTTVKTLHSGFNGPSCVAVDASGNVFVSGWYDGTVKEILAAGGYTTVRTLASGFRNPNGVAVDGSGNVFVPDRNNNRLVKLDYGTPPSLAFANTAVGAESSPQTVTVSNNGNADLTFPVPAAGGNPSISSGFTLDAATTCPDLSISSTVGKLASGTSCNYAVNFDPAAAGINSGSLTLTDNNMNASPAVTQAIPLTGTGTAPHLAFTTPPPLKLAVGQGPGSVAVSVEDANNNVMTNSSATVTLTVTGPNSYSKVYTATASSGVATFNSLASLSTLGSYSYTATDTPDGLTQAVAAETVFGPPSAVSVSPSSGFGTTQHFSFVASSPNGAGNLAFVRMLFNTTLSAVNGCYLDYGVATNQLSLPSDDGSSWTRGQPGASVTLSNSQCSVNLAATTVTSSGNTLTVAPTITFKSGFTAGLQIYMNVGDVTGQSTGWQKMGWWMAGTTPEAAPSAVSVTPSSGFGTTQRFSFVASSPNGAGNLAFVNMLFNTWISRVNGCYLGYLVAGNKLSLVSDDGITSTSGHPGTAGILSNSQCSVDPAATTVTPSGNTLTIASTVTFKSGFKAGVQVYMNVGDIPGMSTGFKKMGWWMAGAIAEAAPSAVSVTPSSGFGTIQQFSFVASSPNGAGNLAFVNMLFNTALSGVNGCYLSYFVAGNQLWLVSDDGTTWTAGQPGVTGTLSNSHCSVNLAATTVTPSGNTLTVSPRVTFNSGFMTGLKIYMNVGDIPGMSTGWTKMSP